MLQFGTGGWRAVIADGFTKENLRLLAAGRSFVSDMTAGSFPRNRHTGWRRCLPAADTVC